MLRTSVLCCLAASAAGFALSPSAPQLRAGGSRSKPAISAVQMQGSTSRKEFLRVAFGSGAVLLADALAPQPSEAEVVCKAQIGGGQKCKSTEIEFTKAFDTKGSTTKVTGDPTKMETYYSQINAGFKTLEELRDSWDDYIAAGDGDVIRRRLGTVGDKSPLHNIRKAFEGAVKVASKSPVMEPEQLDELDECFNFILQGIAEVDYNLYSTAFVGTDETAGKLRIDGRKALDKTIGLYTKFNSIIKPLL